MSNSNPEQEILNQLRREFLAEDQNISSRALGKLIQLGSEANNVLIAALKSTNARTRRLAAEGLAETLPQSAADPLFEATRDDNGEVRSRAAVALFRLGDERGLPALVATLDDYPDILHNPYTASMYALMRGGEKVLPVVIPLLEAPELLTRQRAVIILEAVAARLEGETAWQALRPVLGGYDPAGSPSERRAAVDAWQKWLAGRV